MKRLTEQMKRRIVEHLACFHSPAEAASLIKEEFGTSLTARHVRAYDPTSYQFAAAQKWQDYHAEVRARFRTEVSDVPISGRTYRLRRLQEAFDVACERQNIVLAAKILEQAAKEMGDWYIR